MVSVGLSTEEIIKDFENIYRKKLFPHVLVFVDKELYNHGKRKIVATWCLGDVTDYFPKGDLKFENNPNFDIAPRRIDVKIYMRYKCLRALWERKKPKYGISIALISSGDFLYGSAFAIHQDYQGQGLSYITAIHIFKYIHELGYKNYCGHSINQRMINVSQSGQLLENEVLIDVSDMYIEETKIYPFKLMNLV